MWQNAAVLEYEEAFFADRIPGVAVLGSIIGRFFLDLEGPVQKHTIITDHFLSHLCDRPSC